MVLRHVAVLHQRVLPGRPLLSDRRHRDSAHERSVAAGVCRHLHLRQQRPRDLWRSPRSRRSPSWYAYQYKVDPHWLLQLFNQSPESSRITTWHTQLSTTKWTYTATNRLLFEAGLMAGESPDTILLDPDQVGDVSGTGIPVAPLHRHRRIRPRASPIARPRPSTSTTACRARRSTRRPATSPARTTPRSGSRCSAATSGAATTTTRPEASGTRSTSWPTEPCAGIRQHQCAGHGVAGQPELQPRASSRRTAGRWIA